MNSRVRFGLIFGVIGGILNICVATTVGVCGPFTAIVVGGAAGFFAVRDQIMPAKGDGAKSGAVAGAIAGIGVLIGQMIASVASLTILQNSDFQTILGGSPVLTDGATQLVYYGSGLLFGLCLGAVGIAIAAGTGAAAGYFSSSTSSEIGL
jgi:hypothetical protein